MDNLSVLEKCANELANAAQDLADRCRYASSIATADEARWRRGVLESMARLRPLLFQPAEFLQNLATEVQILGCLQWLGDFQVLPCVPLNSSIAIKDVADLTDVPEAQLTSVLRIMSMTGFFQEPQPGYMAHTALSASFVIRPSQLDMAMFLAETAAPAAYHMAVATKNNKFAAKTQQQSAFMAAFDQSLSFPEICQQRQALYRQWNTYLRYIADDRDDDVIVQLLVSLDWASMSSACIVSIVETALPFMASVLALIEREQSLQLTIQETDAASSSLGSQSRDRIVVEKRVAGTPQTTKDAAIYIVYSPCPRSSSCVDQLRSRIVAELEAHLDVLCGNPSAVLILEVRLIPQKNTAEPYVERSARLLDLTLDQFTNSRALDIHQMMDMVGRVRNSRGRLAVVKQVTSRTSTIVALGIQFQAAGDPFQSTRVE